MKSLYAGPIAGGRAMSHVMVIDDNAHLRATIAALLIDAGYRVSTATQGLEGLQSITREPVDLVVLDLMMPVFSGWEFLRELRAHPQCAGTPVLVASAMDLSLIHI